MEGLTLTLLMLPRVYRDTGVNPHQLPSGCIILLYPKPFEDAVMPSEANPKGSIFDHPAMLYLHNADQEFVYLLIVSKTRTRLRLPSLTALFITLALITWSNSFKGLLARTLQPLCSCCRLSRLASLTTPRYRRAAISERRSPT